MSSPISPPKRPRLSLQIKAPAVPQVLGKSITALKTDFTDPFSPTAFNTLSNAYAAAIETCSPRTAKSNQPPKPVIEIPSSRPKFPRIQTSSSNATSKDDISNPTQRLQTPGPFTNVYPDSPNPPISPGSIGPGSANSAFPFTFTPPQSAHPQEASDPRIFTFASSHLSTNMSPISPNTNAIRRRNTIAGLHSAPYIHPRSLRSILRNSPLPPRSNLTPSSPRKLSLRLNGGNKKVGYNTPLTQTITTNKYIHSHIDLLSEDASPFTPTDPERETTLETTFAYTGDETRDGGQTPGPYEEMRRRMASLGDDHPATTSTSTNPISKKDSLRKRKRKEKKRQWVWTIGDNEEEESGEHQSRRLKERVDTPIIDTDMAQSPTDTRTCSVESPKESTAASILEFPPPRSSTSSRESSFSDERDSDMGEYLGSPHSV